MTKGMWLDANGRFVEMTGIDSLSSVEGMKLARPYRAVVRKGWIEVDGARLLRSLHRTYHGERARFADLTGYEAAVNGRGLFDPGRPEGDSEARRMAVCGLVFAMAALRRLRESELSGVAAAYLSIAPTLYDPNIVTGNVTFCSFHVDEREYLGDVDTYEVEGVAKVRMGEWPE